MRTRTPTGWCWSRKRSSRRSTSSTARAPAAGGAPVINSARDPQYLLKFLPENMLDKLDKLVVVDATGLAEQRGSSPELFVRDLSEVRLRTERPPKARWSGWPSAGASPHR